LWLLFSVALEHKLSVSESRLGSWSNKLNISLRGSFEFGAILSKYSTNI
jgi:hypothetical protein